MASGRASTISSRQKHPATRTLALVPQDPAGHERDKQAPAGFLPQPADTLKTIYRHHAPSRHAHSSTPGLLACLVDDLQDGCDATGAEGKLQLVWHAGGAGRACVRGAETGAAAHEPRTTKRKKPIAMGPSGSLFLRRCVRAGGTGGSGGTCPRRESHVHVGASDGAPQWTRPRPCRAW